MKKLLITGVILGLALLPVAAFAGDGDAGGTIPFVSSLDVTYSAGNATALDAVVFGDYNTGYIAISSFISAATFDANDSCTVAAKISAWTDLPTAYPDTTGGTTAPKKYTDDGSSDFYLQIVGITAEDEVAIQNSFDSYVELTSSDQIFICALDDTGVDGCAFTGNAKINLAWGTDPVGAYLVTVTLTVAQCE